MHHVFFVRNVNGSQPWNAAGYTIARDTDSNLLGHAHGVDAMVTGSVLTDSARSCSVREEFIVVSTLPVLLPCS